jgi:hypothetical protein
MAFDAGAAGQQACRIKGANRNVGNSPVDRKLRFEHRYELVWGNPYGHGIVLGEISLEAGVGSLLWL